MRTYNTHKLVQKDGLRRSRNVYGVLPLRMGKLCIDASVAGAIIRTFQYYQHEERLKLWK
jgi:hypothetical protein